MTTKFVRRAQTLSPFGIGAIYDVEGESLVATDIATWQDGGQVIREPRLETVLGVQKFKMAPVFNGRPWEVTPATPGVPYYRFPQWMFCPNSSCRRMYRWSTRHETGEAPLCQNCAGRRTRLVPMRFVMACPRGHLADVPWDFWAHLGRSAKCESPQLKFITKPGGSGLEFLAIRCDCGAERSLAGIATKNSLQRYNVSCPGRQPWQQRTEEEKCPAVPQVLQRGATNLTFSSIASSIDIPPYSDWDSTGDRSILVTSSVDFEAIMRDPQHPFVPMRMEAIADETGMTVEEVQAIVERELAKRNMQPLATGEHEQLYLDEFDAFHSPDVEADPRDNFVKRRVPLKAYLDTLEPGLYANAAQPLGLLFSSLVQVTRLREVRVLKGFSRLGPAAGSAEEDETPGRFPLYNGNQIMPRLVAADLNRPAFTRSWLPAIEVFGEGIFLSLSESAVSRWEQLPAVQERASHLATRYNGAVGFLPLPYPRLIMLHTLAHLLIRQLSFECGYSIASMRERIYSAAPATGRPMAGILIYTAAGDAEGTLGGLVREGEAPRLISTLLRALQTAEWCSSDPLCRESQGQGMGALNLAACHACALLPETSCTMSNRLLDRTLVLGSSEDPSLGFFGTIMERIFSSLDAERW